MFLVYIIYSEKLSRFYVGTTDDFDLRLYEHNQGSYINAFTLKGAPWNEFLLIKDLSSAQAYRIERHIKSMKSKQFILNLKKYPEIVIKLTERFREVPGSPR